MSETVALASCRDYDRSVVEEKVGLLLELLGGPGSFASEGQSVFIKVNALTALTPDKGVTTHPEVVRAVVKQFRRVTDRVTIGDSPGGPFATAYVKRVYERAGFAEVARETGARLMLDVKARQVKVPAGVALRSITVCSEMDEADCLVSVSKFKTHMFMNVTGAIKNLFGAVPGMNKVGYHSRFPRDRDFADLIVDVMLAASADLNIVDAVVGMDGNGPRAGDLVDMGLLAAGRSAPAVDRLMMEVVGLDADANKPLAAARRRGLAGGRREDILAIGDAVEDVACEGFRLPTRKDLGERVPDFIMTRLGNLTAPRPFPAASRCRACGMCVEVCPADAIAISGGVAIVNPGRCRKCYCCHELCEHDAVDLHRPPLARLLGMNRP